MLQNLKNEEERDRKENIAKKIIKISKKKQIERKIFSFVDFEN